MFNKVRQQISRNMRRVLPVIAAALLLVSCGSVNTTDQEAFRTYGINCMNNGDYEEAVGAFQNALSCSNGSVGDMEIDICLYKAKAQFFAGDPTAAMETYTALINYKDIPEAYFQRGCLNMCLGYYDEAVSDFDAAVENDKKNYALYLAIYDTMMAYGYNTQAYGYLGLAQEISGEKAQDHLYKGRIAFLLSDYEKAISLLDDALKQDCVEANFYLAQVYRALGDDSIAMDYLQTYMDSDQVDGDALMNAGEIELDAANYRQAINFFEQARDMEGLTNRQTLMKELALCYENILDFTSARDVLAEYVMDYPEDEEAARELTFLETR